MQSKFYHMGIRGRISKSTFDGVYPVIFNMTPVLNLLMLLGISEDDETQPTDETQDKSKSPEMAYPKFPAIKESEYALAVDQESNHR